jgi:hypothetical protein
MSVLSHRVILRTALPAIALCAVAAALSRVPVKAESATTFVIPADDGYGLAECISAGKPCGRIVADAWCEAHGKGHARAFGRAEDVTATVSTVSTAEPVEPDSIVVSCSG